MIQKRYDCVLRKLRRSLPRAPGPPAVLQQTLHVPGNYSGTTGSGAVDEEQRPIVSQAEVAAMGKSGKEAAGERINSNILDNYYHNNQGRY